MRIKMKTSVMAILLVASGCGSDMDLLSPPYWSQEMTVERHFTWEISVEVFTVRHRVWVVAEALPVEPEAHGLEEVSRLLLPEESPVVVLTFHDPSTGLIDVMLERRAGSWARAVRRGKLSVAIH